MDRILLQEMQFYSYHGGSLEERTLGQPFQVDLEAELDLAPAGRSDRLEHTVSYAHLFRVVRDVMAGESRELLEALAEEIAGRMLESFPIDGVMVRITKTRPPIKGAVLSGAAVEIHRRKSEGSD
jgi:dihydroneopterin aldolase